MPYFFSAEFDTFDRAELAAMLIRRRVGDIKYISITTQKYRSPADRQDDLAMFPIVPTAGAIGITPSALFYHAGDTGLQPKNELAYREEVRLVIIFAAEHSAKTASHIARGNLGHRIKILKE